MLSQTVLWDVGLQKWYIFRRAFSEHLYSGQQTVSRPVQIQVASCVLDRSAVERLMMAVLAVIAVYCACCMQLATALIDD
jgi:hypothetical protein